ncbi:MAG: hypothetical protein IKD16_03780 [Bacteroidales bacterium]|nr:hypothetical protein [Bacteroidales bacterium]
MLNRKFILPLIFTLLIVAGRDSFAQNRNLTTGSYSAATVPGGNTGTNTQQQTEEGVPAEKPSFTVKSYFRGLAHKDTLKIVHMFAGSVVLPGTAQIYNGQTWKLPIYYGAMGGFIGGAVASNISYQKTGKSSTKNLRTAMIAGAALSYYASILDGVISYKSPQNPLPARASLYSAILPGLGQAYNGDYWKIPIFYGGFAISGYCWVSNQQQYKRYKQMYIDAIEAGPEYQGSISTENMIWYRDKFRRYRDYSIIATALIYVLNIVDANVFAHFNDFDVSDDITLNVEPAIIEPATNVPSFNNYNYYSQAIGLQMNLKF